MKERVIIEEFVERVRPVTGRVASKLPDGVLERLPSFVSGSDGFMSSAAEWHAATLGLMDGCGIHGQGYRLEYWTNTFGDVKQEPHYYELGYSVGHTGKYVAAAEGLSVGGWPII